MTKDDAMCTLALPNDDKNTLWRYVLTRQLYIKYIAERLHCSTMISKNSLHSNTMEIDNA